MNEDVRQEAQCEAKAPSPRPQRPLACDGRESSKSYAVNINQVENGFYVHVGCKNFVFSNISDLLEAIDLYYTDLPSAKKKYLTE